MKLIGRPVPSSQVLQEKRAQRLTEANSKARLLRSRLPPDNFSDTDSDFIFFTDEKVFHVASPVNMQNDRLYVPRNGKKREIAAKRLLCCRPTFYKSLTVSIAVSKLGCSDLFLLNLAWNFCSLSVYLVAAVCPAVKWLLCERCNVCMQWASELCVVCDEWLLLVVSVDSERDGVGCGSTVWHWPGSVCCSQITEDWWLISVLSLSLSNSIKRA